MCEVKTIYDAKKLSQLIRFIDRLPKVLCYITPSGNFDVIPENEIEKTKDEFELCCKDPNAYAKCVLDQVRNPKLNYLLQNRNGDTLVIAVQDFETIRIDVARMEELKNQEKYVIVKAESPREDRSLYWKNSENEFSPASIIDFDQV